MLFPVLKVLDVYITTSRSKCAVPSVAAFCSSLFSYFTGMLLRYCLSDYEILPVGPVITGVKIVFTFPMGCIIIIIIIIVVVVVVAIIIPCLNAVSVLQSSSLLPH